MLARTGFALDLHTAPAGTERVRAGLQRARAEGKKLGRRQGSRGKKVLKLEAKVRALLEQGIGKVARTIGLGVGTVHQIKRELAAI